MFTLHLGDCVEVMRGMADASVDAVVCDPPYGLEFMGKGWDGADGFRRSLNADDAGRENVFGRTSKKAPEYRTTGAGVTSSPGIGERETEWPSNQGWNQFRCRTCGHLSHGGSPCQCEAPEFVRADNRWNLFQQWSERWAAECLRVLKPGGHLLAFGGTRTYHRMACAIEDAGFEIRDSIHWVYGSGFPKSLDVSKGIDKAAGAEREVLGKRTDGRYAHGFSEDAKKALGGVVAADNESGFTGEMGTITAPVTPEAQEWDGWGTALKPAHEPVVVARKPLSGTVVANVLAHGTGALHIDACRVEGVKGTPASPRRAEQGPAYGDLGKDPGTGGGWDPHLGRWPANLVLSHSVSCELVGTQVVRPQNGSGKASAESGGFGGGLFGGAVGPDQVGGTQLDVDGSETVELWECADDCPVAELDRQSGDRKAGGKVKGTEPSHTGKNAYGVYGRVENTPHNDSGGASRFFSVFPGEAPFLYCAKAARSERNEGMGRAPDKPLLWSSGTQNPGSFQSEGTKKAAQNNHPTVKPVALMRWLVRLVAPQGAVVLDPFVGSGTTGVAAIQEGCVFVGIDSNEDYLAIARARISGALFTPSLF